MHARYFPLAFRVSAGNQEPGNELILEARSLQVTGGQGEPGGGGTAAREPRGGGSGCSEASLTTPAGNTPLTAPTGLLFLHGLGGLGPNEPWELRPCMAQERSSFRPPRPSRSPHGLPTLRPRQAEPAAPTQLLLLPPRPAQSSP